MRPDRDPPCSPFLPHGERGVGLMEIIVATIIATIAIVALAYTFGTGRGLVNRYEFARVALAAAQRRMELLSALPVTAPDVQIGVARAYDVQLDGQAVAQEAWTVAAYDDPADGTSAGDVDLKRVTVTVTWGQAGPAETLTLTRLLPLR
jgi:hypothetical protein